VRIEDIVTVVDGEAVDPAPTVDFLSAEAPETIAVEQVSTNAIRVTFSIPVKQINPAGPTDALNPDNYLVTSPNATLPLLQYVTPAGGAPVLDPEPLVEVTVANPTAPTTVVELVFDQALPAGALLFITPQDIVSADVGVPIVATQFFLEVFAEGRPARPLPGQSLDARFDLANPQTPTDAGNDPLGTFQFSEAGDIANDTGRAYLRKRIFRRLSTSPGGFFHLSDYGLRPRDKAAVTATLLRELQRDIEAQVAGEPDVVAVRARLREIAPGVVGVRLRVQDGLGPFELEGRIDLTGGASA